MKTLLLTGCAGFIGANFVKKICLDKEVSKDYRFILLDSLTYAGNYISIEKEIEEHAHLQFVKCDIRDNKKIESLFREHNFDGVLNFAAESHVDRSITSPNIFVETNVIGTLNLLNASKNSCLKNPNFRFLQVGTDEVYGSLTLEDDAFKESTPISPNSPYSASKASADLLVAAYFETYGLPTLTTRCSNNYGPFQFPEKFIPVMIESALEERSLPLYGNGKNVRDWIFVDDHNHGVWSIFQNGTPGGVYNLGGDAEKENIEVAKIILKQLGKNESLLSFVTDRPGHDFRYAMNFEKVSKEIGWTPQVTFEEGMKQTITWYQNNQEWVSFVKGQNENS
jgi:dTDP-glucose 4,6-dehydratase